MKDEKEIEGFCKFSFQVICTEHHKCENCGWNPKVAEKRQRLVREAYGMETGGEQHE